MNSMIALLILLTGSATSVDSAALLKLSNLAADTTEHVEQFLRSIPTKKAKPPLDQDVAALLQMLKREAPVLYRRLETQPREELLRALLETMESGVQPADAKEICGELSAILSDGKKTKIFPGKLICGNRILYLRLDSLDTSTERQMISDLESAARLARKPIGMILDLRTASGVDYDIPVRLTNKLRTDRNQAYFDKLPLVILTSEKSTGAAELLTRRLLHQHSNAILLGKAGSGRIFPWKRAEAMNRIWLVPEISEENAEILPYPSEPDWEMEPFPQIPFPKIADGAASNSKDVCLRQAADLILARRALRGLEKPVR